jgi:hypothetical protein
LEANQPVHDSDLIRLAGMAQSVENNDFTVIFDTRRPITGTQQHCRFAETTGPQITTSVDLNGKPSS